MIVALTSIAEAITSLRAGRPVIVADDEGRENEGDVVLAAESVTAECIAWTVRSSSGFIRAPMTNTIADRLELPLMVTHNQDPRGTAYTVTVDAADRESTGISAADRAHTLRVLAAPSSTPASLLRPGHILPLRADDGGVRARAGHTEAAIDLLKLRGLTPVAAIAKVTMPSGEMARLLQLLELGAESQVPVVTVGQLITYLEAAESK